MKVIEKRIRVRNYDELCELLEIKPKTNTVAKNKQLEELRQFYIIVKDKTGNGYSVQSRKEPKPDKPIDKTRNGKYSRLMNGLVMNYLMNEYEAKPMSLILFDLFKDLKFMAYASNAPKSSKDVVVNKYGKWIYKLADDAINGKIYDLLNNSLRSLTDNGNIFYLSHYLLKGETVFNGTAMMVNDLQTDIDIKNLTNEMLEEKDILNEFILQRMGKDIQKNFYAERNERLYKLYKIRVKEKITCIDIINEGSYYRLNTVKYKDICVKIFEQIKNDLIAKLDEDIKKIYNQVSNDCKEVQDLLGEEAGLSNDDKKKIREIKLQKELYEEYIKYSA
ncbi:hypothetical protein SDC9_69260 [bioreactor metagenome]|uniref:Uncharacterized protein n=1 Tax=bioreactor metagenome TaxID=1076179 RepID=A0A644Y2N5_9ZZZZ